MKLVFKIIATVLIAIVLATGATYVWVSRDRAPTHPTLANADLARLIPVSRFYGDNSSRWDYRISPSGKWLSYRKITGLTTPTIMVQPSNRPVGEGAVAVIQGNIGRYFFRHDDAQFYHITPQNKLLRWQVENLDAEPEDVTPPIGDGYLNFLYGPQHGPGEWRWSLYDQASRGFAVFGPNDNTENKAQPKRVHKSRDGSAYQWLFDSGGEAYMRVRRGPGDANIYERPIPGLQDGWIKSVFVSPHDVFVPLDKPWDDSNKTYALSNRERDKLALVTVDLDTAREELVYVNENVDIEKVFKRSNHPPSLVQITDGMQKFIALDDWGKQFVRLISFEESEVFIHIDSHTNDFSKLTISVSRELKSFEYYLLDMKKNTRAKLSDYQIREFSDDLVNSKPVVIKARDELVLPAQLTLPKGAGETNLPTILRLHGGPAARSSWGYDHDLQFLVNRGYAVLDLNYRGSLGFGKNFLAAGAHQFGRKMQDDVLDARQWLLDQRIADPENLAVMGHSFGGYMSLMALGRDPEAFSAGVALAPITDLEWDLQHKPPSFWWYRAYTFRNFGDPSLENSQQLFRKHSPIAFADSVKVPLLISHGTSDILVRVDQTRRYVEKLNQLSKVRVDAKFYQGERHNLQKWQTRVKDMRRIEEFLAEHLGGRSGGYDYTEIAADIF